MPELLTLRKCHCGEQKLKLSQVSETLYEVRCTKCLDFCWGISPDAAVERWNKLQDKSDNPKEDSTIPQTVKECCKQSANLVILADGRADNKVRVCRICGCKHIRFAAEPGNYFSRG